MQSELLDLPCPAPGTRRSLKVVRFGRPGARPKAYLQAALHGDELPGVMALAHLEELLAEADAAGRIRGEIVLVPVANPIGLSQSVMGVHAGRYDLASMSNFNRGWPDFLERVAHEAGPRLGLDAAANVALVRAALGEAARSMPAAGENAALRRLLYGLAHDADIVLDLHCDLEAVTHLYLGSPLWPDARDLAADIGSEATLLAEVSGGNPFDEAFSGLWWSLQRRFPDKNLPLACLAATVEYRGLLDVSERQGRQDASNLLRFLTRRGLVAGEVPPPASCPEARPLEGVAMVRAPVAGLVSFEAAPGQEVEEGALLAVLVDPLAGEPARRRTEVRAPAGGTLFARAACRLARPGDILAKVAGTRPLPGRTGALLSD
ncbi:succinylglutamate desuccinylase/aspartoacylase family protein [Geminicoccaceae bacterium 1502E]|nr:succinylglutamate desuccinylase/aspartoacylase family protein [Geminicoccaceae bacterium 1502E]